MFFKTYLWFEIEIVVFKRDYLFRSYFFSIILKVIKYKLNETCTNKSGL